MANPYTLVFGQPPVEMIERRAQADRIISEFVQERPANYLNLITGIRGSGKTVFLTDIAQRIGERKEWTVVNMNPQRDLLESLIMKLDSNIKLSRIFQEAEINLQAFGQSLSISGAGAPPIRDPEEALIRMIRSMQRKGRRLLITLDEATNSKDIRVFASAYQLFLREGLQVFLLMTGLQAEIDRLRNAKGMTFLERAPRTVLQPLNFSAMTQKYAETLRIGEDEASRLAKATKGYSFAFQTIGYYAWENPYDPEKAFQDAKEYLKEFAYHKIWTELSPKDREVVVAIQQSGSGEVLQIRQLLQWTSNQFNPYRDRLIKAGVIHSPQNGYVSFSLPWFGEFAEEMKEAASLD